MFPWHHRWTVLAFTLLSQSLILGIHSFSFPFWVVPWIDEFKVPRSQLMLIITSSVLISGLMAPLCGAVLDKFRPRWSISVGAIIFAVGLALISMADSHWEILIIYGTMLAFGIMICGALGCQSLISKWFVANRGAALGISAVGMSIGGFLMPPITTALLAAFGWRETFQLLAVATLLLLLPSAWIILGRDPEPEEPTAIGDTRPVADQFRWTTGKLLRNPDFWIFVACFSVMLMAYLPVLYSIGVYARDLDIAQQRAALVASVGAMALGAGKFSFGKLSDKFDFRLLYWIACVGILTSVVGIGFVQSWQMLMTAVVVLSFCFGAYMPLMSVVVVNRFGSASFGFVLGLGLTFAQLCALSPFLSGLLQEASGSYRVAFILMGLPLLPAMIVMRWFSSGSNRVHLRTAQST